MNYTVIICLHTNRYLQALSLYLFKKLAKVYITSQRLKMKLKYEVRL